MPALAATELNDRYLPDDLVDRMRTRAALTDRENEFFDDDLRELQAHGYLTLFVPEDLGGAGLSLAEVSALQQRLAGAAPGTALAVNMHLMCTGVARAMQARGDASLDWVLDEAAGGEIFAFGISEPSNDLVLNGSNTVAAPTGDGGYALTGVKIFTSLSPAWTRLIVHAEDRSDAENPELVYGFLEREAEEQTPGITVSDDWDVLGMRASQSRATVLDGAVLRADRVVRRLPPGADPDLLKFAIAANFQLLVASVYAGVAWRALEVGAAALRSRRSASAGSPLAEDPGFRGRIASSHLAVQPMLALLRSTCGDFDELVDHGASWPLKLVGARLAAGDAARSCAETALACTGGAGFGNAHEASRLYRDAAASLFHPPSREAALDQYAAALLDQ